MRRLALSLVLAAMLVAGQALGQTGRAAMDVTRETVNVDGSDAGSTYATMVAPVGCAATNVLFFGTPVTVGPQCDTRLTYDPATGRFVVGPGNLLVVDPSFGVSIPALRIPSLTAGRIPVVGADGLIDSNAALTVDGAGALTMAGATLNGPLSATASNTSLVGVFLRTVVEISSAGSGSPNVLSTSETFKTLGNSGTARNYHTLPSAYGGFIFTLVVLDTDGIRVTAGAGDTIRVAGTVSAAAGYIEASAIGDTVTLVALDATQWIATSVIGTWTFGP